MNTRIKSFLFDLDGTLVDSVPWHEEALNRALQEVAGFCIGYSENKENFSGKLTKDKLLLLNKQRRLDSKLNDKVILTKKKYLSSILHSENHKEENKVELFFNLLGYKLACVTNSNKQAALEVLSLIGLSSSFNVLITGDDVVHHKPSSEGYIMAMIALQSIPSETIIVEDSLLGVQAARSTGAHVWEVSGSEEVTWHNLQDFLRGIQ